MSANNISEAFDALRTAFLADDVFTAMLGAADAIYLYPPEIKVSPPLVEWQWSGWNPQDYSATGVYRPRLTMNVFGRTPQECFGIIGHMERFFSIPLHRALEITSDNFRITSLAMNNPVYVGTCRLLASNQSVHQVNVDWDLRINKR